MTGLIETESGYIDFDKYTDEAYDEEGNEVEGETYFKIDNLFINAAFRGNGCAKALISLAIAECKAVDPSLAIKIVAQPKESCVDISRLIAFYESFGLEVVAV